MRVANSKGYSLVELLVGLSVSILVSITALSVMTSATTMQARIDAKTRLSLEVSRLLTMMETEIRRAGMCYQCDGASPYLFDSSHDLHLLLIDETPSQRQGQCLRFAYQQDSLHPTNTVGKDDAKGFRLDTEAHAIEIYENHRDTANWSCESGYWRDISSRALKISHLSFTRNEVHTENGRRITSLTIKVSASLNRQPGLRKDVSRTLVLANTVASS
ncbi:hypothetical protein BZG13_10235 [Salinivibrio sp. ML323]|uniref:Prepilin-type N-terminal cleavage/methylation domain-containing protein n=2 Tax=Vibrionaceae TaxID=641 RepID=A0AB36K3M8_9GAMM|nr:hypothetical protein [Salinivibrio kushneri]OOE57608.1 hypothetical protein BZG13_10235 [Salinivibrio sp. ML323]OOE59636.1 hypothetical protein BZG14_13845 [Salinivibrio sp. IB282]OOE41903.1 hypothetical protein BZG06_14170 [Salinivibrio kushneri]OOE42374.1 hypothetical protein BZG09_13955 [Salinivibrio kushneri]OOE48803.1 hypothetical protein BZG10_10605 [Salinivibrio kushneri]